LSRASFVTITRRLPRAATLLLHLLLVGLAPLADARVEAESRALGVHIEAEGRASCPPAHDHLMCQLCRQVTGELLFSCGFQRTLPGRIVLSPDTPPRALGIALPSRSSPLGPRAPPAF
jgi:hypothetical protein